MPALAHPRAPRLLPVLLLVLAACASPAPEEAPPETSRSAEKPPQSGNEALPEAGYDEGADPPAQLRAAVDEAGSSGRNILLEVGGEWCVWCRILEKYLHDTPEVREAFESSFVIVKINHSEEVPNDDFLGRYPEISGYPHFFVLDAKGALLHSQNTGELEQGRSYDREKMLAFARRWGPGGG